MVNSGCTVGGGQPSVDNVIIEDKVTQVVATSAKPPDSMDLIELTLTPAETIALPTSEPTLTAAPSATPGATAQPTLEPTIAPVETESAKLQELASCIREVLAQNGELSLVWQPLSAGSRQLADFNCPVARLDNSKNGRWLVVTVPNDVGSQAPESSLVLVDNQGNKHQLLNPSINRRRHYFDWVSDSQLVWINEDGQVFLGNGDTSHSLNAPQPMSDVWYAADGIGFAIDAAGAWWRFATEGEQWEQIANLQDEGVLTGLGVAHDGAYSLVFQPGGLWFLPTAFGEKATEITTPELPLVGTDAFLETAVVQLAASPNWFINVPIWYVPTDKLSHHPLDRFVFNTEENRLLSGNDLGLSDTFKILGFDVSPDGRWLSVLVNDKAMTGVYITKAEHLQSGRLVENVAPVGWKLGDASVLSNEYAFLLNNRGDLDVFHLNSDRTFSLPDVAKVLSTTSAHIFVVQESDPTRLLALDLGGNLIATFVVPSPCQIQEYTVSPTGAVYLYLAGDQCSQTLVEYIPL